MITIVELGSFISHSSTKLDFADGVTVFLGCNGSGKSSIIDAITFALFGQHTRKSNKSLIKRGTNEGFARIEFSIKGKKFEAARKINSKGSLGATFSKITENNEYINIAAGERKQFGESMTQEIEKVIGLDFEKLKIASIVRQGEIDAIINSKPKEFKELINAIVGINKLNVASDMMKLVNKKFRDWIRNETNGYDDTHIGILTRDLEKLQCEIKESGPEKIKLESERDILQEEVTKLQKNVEIDTPKIDKINQLESRKNELEMYVKGIKSRIEQEINKNENVLRVCSDCFDIAEMKQDLESKTKRIEDIVEETREIIQELQKKMVSLREKKLLAEKLQLKDNKCPVCGSNVQSLKPLFQIEHLEQEAMTLQKNITIKENEQRSFEQKRGEFSSKLQNSINAEYTLKAHSIKSRDDLRKVNEKIQTEKEKILIITNNDSSKISMIDEHAKIIYDNILKLENETMGFDKQQFLYLKTSVKDKQLRLDQINRNLGAILGNITKNNERMKTIQDIIVELNIAKEYMIGLEDIQAKIFSRDGPVATSLRSWALNAISSKASEYLVRLDTKIQRISLLEKTREIAIICHAKNEELELESLSGGEKVCVAIALRLGMASLLGAANLNLMIFDEPTVNLDAERKKALVTVLSQLSNVSELDASMQFLIITHDSEIFEDASVEKVYKFQTIENSSVVTSVN